MPTINDFSYGYDASGVEQYLEAIKVEYLDKAKEAAYDISGIQNVCNQEWEGIARDNFLANLDNDAKHLGAQFDNLYSVLVSEINSAHAAMSNFDEGLIGEGR